jgi:hypothetical protein
MTPLPADRALDTFFQEARSKLLDLAAIFDRVARGDGPGAATADPRYAKLREAVALLLRDAPNKAELVQQLFSLAYDPNWPRPQPRF